MENLIKEFEKIFTDLKIESKPYRVMFGDIIAKRVIRYSITGLKGNSELPLVFQKEEELAEITRYLENDIFLYNDFLAIHYNNTIEVLLTTISYRTSPRYPVEDDTEDDSKQLFEIGLKYFKNDLDISIEVDKNALLSQLAKYIHGASRYLRRRPIILKINNFVKETSEGIETDTRNILNSLLFDIEYTYDIALETINIESLVRRGIGPSRRRGQLPAERINLVYKKYIPELIQYFHIAEKVDYIPFKFICYYHIIEYFSDRSAYHLVTEEVKKLLLKPDFHIKTNHYVNTAINIFKKENDKHTGDRLKIERVFKQYVKREELKEAINNIELIDYFSVEQTFDCMKPLKLPAINFEQEGNFYGELTKRIYALRCSIVHSNPDFDDTKAIPLTPTPQNIEKLKVETELIMEIARNIIVDSKE